MVKTGELIQMNKTVYEKKLKLAFDGTGGGIVFRYYQDSMEDATTLEDEVEEIIEDFHTCPEDFEDNPAIDLELPKTDKQRLEFINAYFNGYKEGYPELCGSVAGILAKNNMFEEVLIFLEVNDITKPRYWDS